MPHLHLIRGLPGSGKSTRAQDFVAQGYVLCEADQYFMKDGVYCFRAFFLKQAHTQCQDNADWALAQRRNVVVANTFTQRWELEPYYVIAAQHGATVTQETMTGAWPNIHGVSVEAIERMRARWEA